MKSKIVIETPRLLLRELVPEDADSLYALNSDPDVVKYTGDSAFATVDEALRFLEGYSHYGDHGFGRWAVILKTDNKFIGWCGLKYNEKNEVDLGYRFFKNSWGNGYATESAWACLEYGFKKLNHVAIVGRVLPENIVSVKVLEKLGMKFWKQDTCHGLDNALYYVMTKQQWENLQKK